MPWTEQIERAACALRGLESPRHECEVMFIREVP